MAKNENTMSLLFKPARLFDGGGDLNKYWFVHYSYCDPVTNKFKRFKLFGKLNQLHQRKDRLKEAHSLINAINEKLTSGFSPFLNIETYTDNFLPHKQKDKEKKTDYSIRYYLNKYLAIRAPRLRSKTKDTYTSKLRIFSNYLSEFKLDKIPLYKFSHDNAKEFLNYLTKKSPTTINEYVRTLKSFFNDFIKNDLLIKNPFDNIPKIPELREGKLPFSRFQIEKIKQEIKGENEMLWVAVNMLYYCFIRPGELRGLKISDIDLDNTKIRIGADISKNKKTQFVTIPTQLVEILIEYKIYNFQPGDFLFSKSGTPGQVQVSRDYLSKTHKKSLDRLGFDSTYSFYSWKHTGALNAWRAGISIKDIKEQMRHHSLDMTDIYLKSIGAIECLDIKNRFPVL